MFSAYFQYCIVLMKNDGRDTFKTSVENAKKNIQKRLPMIHEFFSRLQVLQRLVVLTITLVTFYLILVLRKRNLIDFGFFFITNCIVYSHLNKYRFDESNVYIWKILQFYSAVVILSNISLVFLQTNMPSLYNCFMWND